MDDQKDGITILRDLKGKKGHTRTVTQLIYVCSLILHLHLHLNTHTHTEARACASTFAHASTPMYTHYRKARGNVACSISI